jgi:hypothetical protein
MCKLIGRKSAPRKSEFNTQREKKVAALTSNDLLGGAFKFRKLLSNSLG